MQNRWQYISSYAKQNKESLQMLVYKAKSVIDNVKCTQHNKVCDNKQLCGGEYYSTLCTDRF